jgi:hypothetical protein
VESGGYKITGRSRLDDVGRSAYQLAMTAMNRQSNSSAVRELQCLPPPFSSRADEGDGPAGGADFDSLTHVRDL